MFMDWKNLILLKCPYQPKCFTSSMLSPSKYQWYVTEIGKKILKFIWKDQRP